MEVFFPTRINEIRVRLNRIKEQSNKEYEEYFLNKMRLGVSEYLCDNFFPISEFFPTSLSDFYLIVP